MAQSMADLLKKAYADTGVPLPGSAQEKRNVMNVSTKVKTHNKAKASFPKNEKSRVAMGNRRPAFPEKAVEKIVAPDLSCYGTPCKPKQAVLPTFQMRVASTARLALNFEAPSSEAIRLVSSDHGHRTQCATGSPDDDRQIVLGLDFGTSCVKAVIGDPVLGKAFAVPFQEAEGVEHYLLPSRLYGQDGRFLLHGGQDVYRDLKLSLIASSDDDVLIERVIAFLALVIRHARGWLFDEHGDLYRRSRLFWKLSVGLPVSHHFDGGLFRVFNRVGIAAWLLAGSSAKITTSATRAAWIRAGKVEAAPETLTEGEYVEVSIVPEIAAQIYGFVNSSRFNPRDRNLYLMVDVGAGSVDSSLFHVKPARGGKWDFEFFTSAVEPHGVMNLHRYRVNWWEGILSKQPEAEHLLGALRNGKYATDRAVALPESFRDYFDGVSVRFQDDRDSPDEVFFRSKVVQQVRGKSYWRAWKDGHLQQSDLAGIPTFYCGGGMRMHFYERLQDELRSMPGYSWLKAQPRRVELPRNLEAPGLRREEFDRLTVAYGLSFLEVGKVTKALPPPRLPFVPESSWRENYVGKDIC